MLTQKRQRGNKWAAKSNIYIFRIMLHAECHRMMKNLSQSSIEHLINFQVEPEARV